MRSFQSASSTHPVSACFGKFFDADGRLNLTGELELAAGIVALWALAMPAITTLPMMPKASAGCAGTEVSGCVMCVSDTGLRAHARVRLQGLDVA